VILEYAKLAKINPVLLIDDQYSVRFMERQIPKDVLKKITSSSVEDGWPNQ
jgi:hypothetical protein